MMPHMANGKTVDPQANEEPEHMREVPDAIFADPKPSDDEEEP